MPRIPTFLLFSGHALAGIGGLALTLAGFLALGALVTDAAVLPEIQIVAGWGLACLVLTLWGVLLPLPLYWPALGLAIVAVAVFAVPGLRRRVGPARGAGRLVLLLLPLMLVLAPLRPSQVDTWLNLLPNAAYLFDFSRFPTDSGPPAHSFLAGAPYNTQFVAYLASLPSGAFADSVMSWFSVTLQVLAGLLFARLLAGEGAGRRRALPWWTLACGFLLAVPLNAGFVPRIFFASYGEAPLAACAVFALYLGLELTESLIADKRSGGTWAALLLVLCALVNTKQSGPGLLLPIVASLGILWLCSPLLPRLRALTALGLVSAVAMGFFGLWKVYVARYLPGAELSLMPMTGWNLDLLPQIFGAMLHTIFQKITYFLCLLAVLVEAVRRLRLPGRDTATIALWLASGIILFFNAFLIFTYVAHFPRDWAIQAHSYFRYNAQLSLVVMLALILWLRPHAEAWLASWNPGRREAAIGGVIALTLLLPIGLVKLLRFDLDMPQPLAWNMAKTLAKQLPPGAHVDFLLPGDLDREAAAMFEGVLRETPPRREDLVTGFENHADAPALAHATAGGYSYAFISCTPPGLVPGVPPGIAALLVRDASGWKPRLLLPYAKNPALERHWSAMLPRASFCGVPSAAKAVSPSR